MSDLSSSPSHPAPPRTSAMPMRNAETLSSSFSRENGNVTDITEVGEKVCSRVMGSNPGDVHRAVQRTNFVQRELYSPSRFSSLSETQATVWKRVRDLREPVTAFEVAEALGCSVSMAKRHLAEFVKRNLLDVAPNRRGHVLRRTGT